MEIVDYIEIMVILKTKQMILQGPPGTSKTYTAKQIVAKKLANAADIPYFGENNYINKTKDGKMLSNEKDWITAFLTGNLDIAEDFSNRWEMVQFHPSYGYEDFVRGITVETNEEKRIVYKTVNKIFGEMCERANDKDNRDNLYFLIIDEINRADVATVFGELIYALEYRGEEIAIPYKSDETASGNKLVVPENLYIIATMNTADKSVGNIDYAIRRRFVFFDCPASEEILKEYHKNQSDTESIPLFNGVKKFLRDNLKTGEYREEDFQIGHTYFMADSEDEQNYKLRYQVLPILREYYIDGILKRNNIENNKQKLQEYLSGKVQLNDTVIDEIKNDLKKE